MANRPPNPRLYGPPSTVVTAVFRECGNCFQKGGGDVLGALISEAAEMVETRRNPVHARRMSKLGSTDRLNSPLPTSYTKHLLLSIARSLQKYLAPINKEEHGPQNQQRLPCDTSGEHTLKSRKQQEDATASVANSALEEP